MSPEKLIVLERHAPSPFKRIQHRTSARKKFVDKTVCTRSRNRSTDFLSEAGFLNFLYSATASMLFLLFIHSAELIAVLCHS